MGVIIINANVKDYKLYINGAAAESPCGAADGRI